MQRRETMGLLQHYVQLRSSSEDQDLAWQLHLDRLIYNAEAELRWLDRVEERLSTVALKATASAPTYEQQEVKR